MSAATVGPAGDARAGVLLYLLGVFLFALNDALGKWLVTTYSVQELMLVRSLGAAIVLGPLVWRNRINLVPATQRWLQGLRVACMAVDSFAFYYATRSLPLADVMTFYLAAPLIITALSGWVLGERIGAFRWGAVVIGFIGVVIALQPSSAGFSLASLVALAGSTMFATGIATTRGLRDSPWLALVVRQFLGAGLAGAALSPFGWVTPTPFDLALMGLVGLVSMSCFIAITKALTLADASLVAPFQYSSIVWAVLLGWMFWGDLPGTAMTVGIAIIVASGLAVWSAEGGRTEADAASVV